jgi:hypothetical protein
MKSRKPGGSGSSMDNRGSTSRTAEGSLGKDIQASLGTQLRKHYQKIIEEGVPDRFMDLLQRYEQKVQGGPAGGAAEARDPTMRDDSEGKDSSS